MTKTNKMILSTQIEKIEEKDIIKGVLTIPEGVTYLFDCEDTYDDILESIKKIIIPTSVIKINSYFACSLPNLVEIVILSNNVEIGTRFADDCPRLKKITMTEGVNHSNYFANACPKLKQIVIISETMKD